MSLQIIIHAARALAVGFLKPIGLAAVCACACVPSLASDTLNDGVAHVHRIAQRSNEPKSYVVGSAEAAELYRACAVDQRPAACKLLIKGDEAKGFATARAVAFAHITLGRLAERDGNAADALKYYRQAKERDPSLTLLDEKIEKLAASLPQKSLGEKSTEGPTPKSISPEPRAQVATVPDSDDVGGGAAVAASTPQPESLSEPSCPPVCDYEATYPITTGSLPSVDREGALTEARMNAQPLPPGGSRNPQVNIPKGVVHESRPALKPQANPAPTSRIAAIAAGFQPSFAPTARPRAKPDGHVLQLTILLTVLSVMTIMTLLTVLWSRAVARAAPSLAKKRELPAPDVLRMPAPEPAPARERSRPVCSDGKAVGPAADAVKTIDALERRDRDEDLVITSVPITSTPADEAVADTVEAVPVEAPTPVRDVKAERLVLSGLAEQVCRDALVKARRPDLDTRVVQPIKIATQEVLELQSARAPQEAMLLNQHSSGKGPSGGEITPIVALTAELTALWSAILRRLPMDPLLVAGPHQKISFPAPCLFDVIENKRELLDELIAIGEGDKGGGRSVLLAMNGSGATDGLNAGKSQSISAAAQDDLAQTDAPRGVDPDTRIRALFKGGPIQQVLDLKVFEEDTSRPKFSFVFARDHEARADLHAVHFASDLQQLFDRQAITLILDHQGRLASHVRNFISTDTELKERHELEEIYPADRKWSGALNPFDLDLSSLAHFDREKLLGAAMDIQTQAFENLVGPTILRGNTRALRHLLRAAHSIPNASLETLLNLLQPNALDRFAKELASITSRSTVNFFKTEFQDQAYRDFAKAFRSALSRRLEDYRLRQLTCNPNSFGREPLQFWI